MSVRIKSAFEYRGTTAARKGQNSNRLALIEELWFAENSIQQFNAAEATGNPLAKGERLKMELVAHNIRLKLDNITFPHRDHRQGAWRSDRKSRLYRPQAIG